MSLVPQENAIIDALDPMARKVFRRFVAWCEDLLEGTRYRISLESFTKPWIAGRRTVEQQQALYEIGRTKPGQKVTNCDGRKKKSNHQSGMALHLGMRWRRSGGESGGAETGAGKFIRHQTKGESSEANQLFQLIVAEAERRRILWGGRWKGLLDYHHFEIEE